jgi:hypothetical protein
MAWNQVRVTFIPKPEKSDYAEVKVYRPLSLSSFVLKTMEKLVHIHIREGVLKEHPLNRNQHVYPAGKSTATACKEIAL